MSSPLLEVRHLSVDFPTRRGTLLAIDDVAHAAATIGYELMCALASRVPVKVSDTL